MMMTMPNALIPVSSSPSSQHQHQHSSITFSLRKQQEQELESIVLQEDVRYIDQIREVQQESLNDALNHLQKHYDATLYGPSYIQLSPSLDDVDKTLASLVSDVVTASRRIRSWPKVPTVNVATNANTGALEERAQQQQNGNLNNNQNMDLMTNNNNDPQKSASSPHNHYRDWETDRKSTRLNSSHEIPSRMPSSA